MKRDMNRLFLRSCDKGRGKSRTLRPKSSDHPAAKSLLSSSQVPDGQKIRFTPLESGKHRLHVLYGGEDAPGSPFTFMVDEPGFPTAEGDGLLWALADEPASFRVDAKNLRGKLEVLVQGPSTVAKTTISPEKHWRVQSGLCGDGSLASSQ